MTQDIDERLTRIEERLELVGRAVAELGLSVSPEVDPLHPASGSLHAQARIQRLVPNVAKVVKLYLDESRPSLDKLLAARERSREEGLRNANVIVDSRVAEREARRRMYAEKGEPMGGTAVSAIEVRDDGGSGPIVLSSYASVFEVSYTIRGGSYTFNETVARGAFTQSLNQSPDVVFRTEHAGPPLARTGNGSLRLSQDNTGLRYEARLDRSDPDVQALVPKIRNGNYSESSFAFRTVSDSWSDDRSRRTLLQCDIDRGDVSIVTYGASPQTGKYVEMSRSQGSDQEFRAWTEAVARSGWGGPGALTLRGAWSNQHGTSCATCDGSGECPDCEGKGWTSGGSGQQDETPFVPRSTLRPRYDEFDAELRRLTEARR